MCKFFKNLLNNKENLVKINWPKILPIEEKLIKLESFFSNSI